MNVKHFHMNCLNERGGPTVIGEIQYTMKGQPYCDLRKTPIDFNISAQTISLRSVDSHYIKLHFSQQNIHFGDRILLVCKEILIYAVGCTLLAGVG